MKMYTSNKYSMWWVVSLVFVAGLAVFLLALLTEEKEKANEANVSISETSSSEDRDLSDRAQVIQKQISPFQIGQSAALPESHLPKLEESFVQDEAAFDTESSTILFGQPTEQQFAYQTQLEQKVDGMIYVDGPLLPAILKSQEFTALTKQQKNIIAQRILKRLNNGELAPQAVFP